MNKKAKAGLICAIVVFAVAIALFVLGFISLTPRVVTYKTRGFGFSNYSYTYSYGPLSEKMAFAFIISGGFALLATILLLILSQVCNTNPTEKKDTKKKAKPEQKAQETASQPQSQSEPEPAAEPQTESQPEAAAEEQQQ